MISLLLTLFISLFSICTSVYPIEDHNENIIDDYDLQPKGLMYVEYQGSTIYCASNTDLHDNDFVLALYNRLAYNLGTGEYAFDHNFKCQVVNWRNLDMHYFETSTPLYWCTAISVTCQQFAYEEYGKLLSYYRVALYYDNNGNLTSFLTFDFAWVYPSSDALGYSNNGIMIIQYQFDQYHYIYDDSYYNTCGAYFNNTNSEQAYQSGFSDGQRYGEDVGYQNGYQQALDDTSGLDSTASTIFEGIFDVGLLPVNVFLTIFNFELFGVNIAGIVSGLLTLAVVVIVLRFLLGGKNNDK